MLRALATLTLAALLTACGGGDPDDDHMPAPSLPDCQANPQSCQ